MILRNTRVLFGAFIAIVAGGWVACSASSSDPSVFGPGQSGSGGAGGDDASVLDDSSTGGTTEGGFLADVLTGDAPMEACAAEHAQAEQLPLDLYIMVDRSSSMGSLGKWDAQSNALTSFFQDPKSNGLYLALRFFPLDDTCNPKDAQCSGNAYVKPLVDWGMLPGNASTLVGAVTGNGPDGCFTPTQEALHGVLEGARQRQIAEPMHVVAAVIASDGEPCCGDCPCEADLCMGQLANQYATGTPPVKTFAIAADPSAMGVLTAIAFGGGTKTPFDATGGTAAFLDALNAIRGAMLACEYKMPATDAGHVNPALVQVEYTPGGSTDTQSLPKKASAADCGSGPGWYYDNEQNPTKISLCTASCTAAQNDQNGKVDILLGCSSTQR